MFLPFVCVPLSRILLNVKNLGVQERVQTVYIIKGEVLSKCFRRLIQFFKVPHNCLSILCGDLTFGEDEIRPFSDAKCKSRNLYEIKTLADRNCRVET